MKIPKTVKRYCRYCKAHTEQKVSQNKKRQARSLTQGAKIRREFGKGKGNLGTRGSKPPISKFKLANKKLSKKTDLRYECTVCKKKTAQASGIRAKKVEFA